MATLYATSASIRLGLLPRPTASVSQRFSTASSRSGLSSSFTASRAVAASSSCSFAGCPLYREEGWCSSGLVLVRAKVAIGCTKRSRSRKSVARVSGFRVRLSTTDGRRVLQRRRAKGRKQLVPATNPNSRKSFTVGAQEIFIFYIRTGMLQTFASKDDFASLTFLSNVSTFCYVLAIMQSSDSFPMNYGDLKYVH